MSHSHRIPGRHTHDDEPVHGLPEVPPADERILWQGSPDWQALALRAFHARKLAIYFALMLALRVAVDLHDGVPMASTLRALAMLAPLALIGMALVVALAWLSAHTTVYTLTQRRIVMRIGIVLTLSFNLPLKRIAAADLARGPHGTGDISLELSGDDRIAWLQLWPHARPWKLARPQPMLRCVPEAEAVARLLVQTWSGSTGLGAAPAGSEPVTLQPIGPTALAGR